MSITNTEKTFPCFSLTGFGGGIVFLGVSLYYAYAKIDLMLEHLKHCSAVTVRIPLRKGDPCSRIFLLGGIISVFITPNILLREGGANSEDLKNFPASLRRRLIMLHWSGIFFIALLVIAGAFPLFNWI